MPSSSTSCGMPVEKPSLTPERMQATWMIRAKMCASGRKSSVRSPSWKNSLAAASVCAQTQTKLPWVITQPLGLPVVPEV
jgi:hypothetical protein